MHYVFLLHGSGRNKPGWSTSFRTILEERVELYTGLKSSSQRKRVEFVEINYGDVLEQNVQRLLNGGYSLGKFNEWLQGAFDRRKNGLPLVDGASKKELAANFTLEFLMDALTYLWNPEMARYVQLKVGSQVLNVVKEASTGTRFSFIGHGVGTKVAFDFLHNLYGEMRYPIGMEVPFRVTPQGNPSRDSMAVSYLHLLGNAAHGLSKIDAASFDMNNSHVRLYNRFSTPKQGGIVRLGYRTYGHRYDWLSRLGLNSLVKPNFISGYSELTAVTGLDMRSLEAYINHPAVHIPIIEDLYMSRGKKVENRNQIMGDYETQKNIPAVAAELSTLLSQHGEGGALEGKIHFFDFLKRLADAFLELR